MSLSAASFFAAQPLTPDELKRLYTITVARSVSLGVIFLMFIVIVPPQILPYLAFLLGCFGMIGWTRYLVEKSIWRREWHAYAFILLDFAFMTYAITSENLFAERRFPPQAFLHFENFIFLYILLAAQAISFRPLHLVWGGICGATCWGAHITWLTTLPDTITRIEDIPGAVVPSDGSDILLLVTQPTFVDLGVQLQHIVIFLIVAALLAVSTEASLRLARRQVSSERRFANLSRYVAAEAVEELADRNDPFGAEREREAAILFTDIVGFSSMSEAKAPREVIGILRDTHAQIEQAIFAHNGVLDKFIGDGAMATFGAMQSSGAPARDAVECAKDILQRLEAWNANRPGPRVRVVIGVHYGPVVVGDVGSERRMELAVIGDTVNVASRLEEMTRRLQVDVAVSDEAYAAAGQPDGWRSLGEHPVAGRAEPVKVWSVAE